MEIIHTCDEHCDKACWYEGSDQQDQDQNAIDRADHDRGECEPDLCPHCELAEVAP